MDPMAGVSRLSGSGLGADFVGAAPPSVIACTPPPVPAAPGVIASCSMPPLSSPNLLGAVQASATQSVSQSLVARHALTMASPRMASALRALTSVTSSASELSSAIQPAHTSGGWRSSLALRQSSWLCTNCQQVVPRELSVCQSCGTSQSQISTVADASELAAISDDCAATRYGRNLGYATATEPLLAEGIGALPGSGEYIQAVQLRTTSMMRSAAQRRCVEPKLRKGANVFDGWLAMQTGEAANPVRVASRAQVQLFVARDDVEALVTDFITDYGRSLPAYDPPRMVRALPKGGYWLWSLTFVREHDVHIIRAAFALQFDGVDNMPFEQVADAILEGLTPHVLYERLAAVGASVFARMACYERGPSGRARRQGIGAPTLSQFADNGIVMPRYLVAMLVRSAMAADTTTKLVTIERARVAAGSKVAHIVARGASSSADMLLLRLDGEARFVWVPERTMLASSAGTNMLATFDAMYLGGFGYKPFLVQASSQVPSLFSKVYLQPSASYLYVHRSYVHVLFPVRYDSAALAMCIEGILTLDVAHFRDACFALIQVKPQVAHS